MDVQGLFVTRTKTEMLSGFLAAVSFLVGVIPAIIAQETRIVTLSVLALFSLAALTWFGALITRPAFTIRGYNEVMALLARLAKTSRHRLWTVRSHTGPGIPETSYFQAIEDRLRDRANPLEDFRRIVRLSPNVSDHLKYLISSFYRQDNVAVHYYQNHGPQFDFMVVDGRIGVIGFPMAGGKGNIGAVVLRRREAVEGLETIFNELCRESQLLFEGDARRAPQIEAELQQKLTDIFSIPTLGRT
jgi:hypothetical protein